ncbi:hypothetical protein BASA60_000619 [Batrachochytrium salamandrivorans]|nr:hypothetical protein BASA60_000619 [Batrachochytrium salamandrivorans]KAH9275313.1 hypothetical protein BASA83_002081 [Batrachochytrium salamandrivorans]
MKLISFAVVSFLAITVSAYPGLDTHDIEQSQSTSTQNSHQPVQDPFQTGLSELEEDYKQAQALVRELGSSISVLMQERSSLKSAMGEIKEELKKDISEDEEQKLTDEYNSKFNDFEEISTDIEKNQEGFLEAMRVRDDTKEALNAFKATQK